MALDDINLNDADNFLAGTPHHWFRELRRTAPVWFHQGCDEVGKGYWCITKYEDVKYISTHPELFSSARGGIHIPDVAEEELAVRRNNLMMMDPPQHVKFRRIVQRHFTPRMVRELAPRIRERCSTIVNGIIEKGECDFVKDVAAELPLQVICDLLGVAQGDRHYIFDLVNQTVSAEDPDFHKVPGQGRMAREKLCDYGYQLARSYDGPSSIDTLTSQLLRATVDNEKLTELEFGMFFYLLLVAGSETTRSVIVSGLKLLIEHPEQMEQILRDPALLQGAIEEMLRYEPAAHYFRRTATADTELRGKAIREGDKLVLWYPSANRDEDIFADPDRFDIHRHPNDHLAFGIGEHFCLGASLARTQLDAMFSEVLGRMSNIQLAGPVRRLRSTWLNSTKEMPIAFDPGPRSQVKSNQFE